MLAEILKDKDIIPFNGIRHIRTIRGCFTTWDYVAKKLENENNPIIQTKGFEKYFEQHFPDIYNSEIKNYKESE